MKADLQQNISETFHKLRLALDLFHENDIDTIPADGGWSAGLTAEHIIKSTSGMSGLSAKTAVVTRVYDEKIPAIKEIFLDFTTKMKSPDFLIPTAAVHDKSTLLTQLDQREKEMLELTENADLRLVTLVFEVPGFGPFTIFEAVSFALIHTQRHIVQLENIHRKITA